MSDKVSLPPNHKRVISVTARLLEKELDDLENLILNDQHHLTKRIKKTLNPDQRKSIIEIIKKIRTENEEMFHKFDLDFEKLSEHQLMFGKVSYLITILSDSTSKGLKGYGALGQEESGILDNCMNDIISKFNDIESILTKETK
ncbi:hypothetical protein BMS3Abin04_01383 [bacterium BMS3Abin04]|nr:hypothetical protein BMS3Abin04_01383 [bacterium BMS3Abin04]